MDVPRLAFIGFDASELAFLRESLPADVPVMASEMLPRIRLMDGRLEMESPLRDRLVPISAVVFHGIFEHDLDFLAALVLWGGPCFPAPQAMLDCRLRLPGLVRALAISRFAGPPRGFLSPGVSVAPTTPQVAKWGNWHCGENKERIDSPWTAHEPTLVEPFFAGDAVRVLMLGEQMWQIRLTGTDWRKSVHGPGAAMMPMDAELADDTRTIRDALGLSILANDYMVTPTGERRLLEVNHIPSVTCFPEVWRAYRDVVRDWLMRMVIPTFR
ncbi:ATP-grasp domain-containing protein [Tuwongella immobilis]|uniref:Alpha-l-glutamate ligase: Uncharacterized protein n=1 Tax=Tuwongella immobilis TaxID=692036 RepID=A0A6C2YJ52_9BACT|nr:hypothetical protein [Tuwongella immobilis]VIP01578.1 alpha-l-glutamate ligase : Uncharacterized protein OS=Chamaesiphon minutus PCC 6605 GN=Cha6605_4378 PE=4 SV=1 [Tuwongella immobilis]VTR98824.1 alpha-l-glutamate ligase : Uncharacterized protein OS=Chamaesiphon minutus PCC 6605 GN=Cha6605_4378 PE=4 SV=1 [Tuwongella immobilis]